MAVLVKLWESLMTVGLNSQQETEAEHINKDERINPSQDTAMENSDQPNYIPVDEDKEKEMQALAREFEQMESESSDVFPTNGEPTTPLIRRRASSFLVDPMCDPKMPRSIQFEDVTSAAFKIRGAVVRTPCSKAQIVHPGIDLYFKKDFLQKTGSFKERGARYTLLMLSEEQKKKGVISASAGNHALGLCYHGQQLGIPVTVVMPVVAPIMKIQSCRKMKAEVIVKGSQLGETKKFAMKKAIQEGITYINGYDHPHIMAGQGTIGLEILEQVPDLEAVVVPVGGGGLIAGVATAIKGLNPSVRVIGVESENCPTFTASRKAGKLVTIPMQSTLADGLSVPLVGFNAFNTANKLIDEMILVEEDWIAIAILRLVEREKAVVEGAGAIGVAAVISGKLDHLKGKKVVVLMCGGNIDTTILGRCLERGLAAEGRLLKFSACVTDRPGGWLELARVLAGIGVSIKDIGHERAWLMNDVFSVRVSVVCETRDWEHTTELMETLRAIYPSVKFHDITHPPRPSVTEV